MKNKRHSFKKIEFKKKEKEPLKPLFKKQKLVIAMSVLLVVLITMAGSFAVFTKTGEGNEYNVVQVGDLELSYVDLSNEGNVLQLADSYPTSDINGEASTPYRFSVENTGTIIADYTVKIIKDIDTINADGCGNNLIDDSYLRFKFDNEISQNLKDKLDAVTNEYVIYSGTLAPFESNIHEIRLWINENSPNSILGTHYHGKVVIEVTQNNTTNPYERPYRLANQFALKADKNKVIDFTQISSATNGRGIYKYQEDGEDIYYWRGKVTDNHVIFAGYCWEMIRTTKTGGVKMIYDGIPMIDINGKKTCPNIGVESSLAGGNKVFNSSYGDNAYVGYMYGLSGITKEPLGAQCIKLNSATVRAEIGTETTEIECRSNGGKWTTTAYQATHANVVNSNTKEVIDTWFKTSGINTTENLKKLEDTVYCNDRSISGTGLGYGYEQTGYITKYRLDESIEKRPSLECPNVNDRFTVSEDNGNGALTYPVGLLTADEVALAGGGLNISNKDYYLYTGQSYWTSSPYDFASNTSTNFYVDAYGYLGAYSVYNAVGIRPTVSLASWTEIAGLGTEDNPYEVK